MAPLVLDRATGSSIGSKAFKLGGTLALGGLHGYPVAVPTPSVGGMSRLRTSRRWLDDWSRGNHRGRSVAAARLCRVASFAGSGWGTRCGRRRSSTKRISSINGRSIGGVELIFFEIVLPGMLVGGLVGFVTQRYPSSSHRVGTMVVILLTTTLWPSVFASSGQTPAQGIRLRSSRDSSGDGPEPLKASLGKAPSRGSTSAC